MSFKRRLFLFIVGVSIGSLICVGIFGKERFSCSGYFPNERVLEELKTKTFENDSAITLQLKEMGLENAINDSILSNAKIDFDKSEPRLKPCGKYWVAYPKSLPKYILHIEKCKKTAKITSIEAIQ